METLRTCIQKMLPTSAMTNANGVSSGESSAPVRSGVTVIVTNHNSVNKRTYPFEKFLYSEPKVPKICEKSFRPLIQQVFPDTEIVRLHVRHGASPGDNFTSIIYAIEANLTNQRSNSVHSDKDRDEGTVYHLVMKCFPNHPARQDFFRKIDIFRKELDMYRFVLPELERFQNERFSLRPDEEQESLLKAFPKFYGGAYGHDYNRYWENSNGSLIAHGNFILMEDIRKTQDYRMPSKFIGLDLPHCTLVVKEMARLHALSMAYIKVALENKSSLVDRFDCLKETVVTALTEEDVIGPLFNSSFNTSMSIVSQETGPDSIYTEKMRQFSKRVHWVFGHILAGNGDDMSLLEMLGKKPNFEDLHDQNKERKRNSGWFVLTHGDCYFNNILFKYENDGPTPTAVKLVDLQLARENCLAVDLVHFIYLSTTPQFRKDNLENILETYFQTFQQACSLLDVEPYPDFTLANLTQKFHKAKVIGMISSLFVLPVVLRDANNQEPKSMYGEKVDGPKAASQVFRMMLKNENAENAKNSKLHTRVVELVKEMADEGVI